jgi:hypothetical protein
MSFLLHLSLITLLRRKEIKYAYVVVYVSKKIDSLFQAFASKSFAKRRKEKANRQGKRKNNLGGIGYPMQSSKKWWKREMIMVSMWSPNGKCECDEVEAGCNKTV